MRSHAVRPPRQRPGGQTQRREKDIDRSGTSSRAIERRERVSFGRLAARSQRPGFVIKLTALTRRLMVTVPRGEAGPTPLRHRSDIAPAWNAIPFRQRGGAMVSGTKPVGRPSMLCMFFKPQYFRRLSTPRSAQ